jgi:hypothetical protein
MRASKPLTSPNHARWARAGGGQPQAAAAGRAGGQRTRQRGGAGMCPVSREGGEISSRPASRPASRCARCQPLQCAERARAPARRELIVDMEYRGSGDGAWALQRQQRRAPTTAPPRTTAVRSATVCAASSKPPAGDSFCSELVRLVTGLLLTGMVPSTRRLWWTTAGPWDQSTGALACWRATRGALGRAATHRMVI